MLLDTCQGLSSSLAFTDFGLSSANHTTEAISAKELFALVSDIAVQHLCAARLV
jgi:hypothetical protein